MPSQFPSNAHGQKNPPGRPKPAASEKKIERVTVNKAVKRKKPMGSKFRDTFGGDDSRGVAGHVIKDVIIPAIKNMIADGTSAMVEGALFGNSSPVRRSAARGAMAGYTSYSSMRGPQQGPVQRREDPRALGTPTSRGGFDSMEYELVSRPEANDVLGRMYDILSQYDVVSQRDFFDLIGEPATHVDEKWGWTDLQGSTVRRAGTGYRIDLPRPQPIE